ncbi:uncharacterized protein LOC141686316 [Apium graveolens]|uniref:uncharacterized protein LOC141686316 n=1 Tax=Apium graveolens TaxID=4045 RepID=UPI003D7AB616
MASLSSSTERTETDPVDAQVVAPVSEQILPPLPPEPAPEIPLPPEWEDLEPQIPMPPVEIPEMPPMEPEAEPPVYAPMEQPVLFPAPLAIYAPVPGVYQFPQPEFIDEIVVDGPLPSRGSSTDLHEHHTVTYQRFQAEREERIRWQNQCREILGLYETQTDGPVRALRPDYILRERLHHIHRVSSQHLTDLRQQDLNINLDATLLEWMERSSHQNSKEQFEGLTMLCLALWRNRNNIVWNQRGSNIAELVESANLYLSQWEIAQDKSFYNYLGFMTLADGNEQWQQPPEDMIKVNTDEACFVESNSYTYSMISGSKSFGKARIH